VHASLHYLRDSLQPLRCGMPEGIRRPGHDQVHCAGYGLRSDLHRSGRNDGARQWPSAGNLQSVRRYLPVLRRWMCAARHGALPGMREGLPSLRWRVPQDSRNGLNPNPWNRNIREIPAGCGGKRRPGLL